MKLKSTLTTEDLEQLYCSATKITKLTLPRSFKKLRLGLLSRLAQFFITVSKENPNTKICFYTVDSSDIQAKLDILTDPHSTVALLMFDDVEGKDGSNLKAAMNHLMTERFNKHLYRHGHRLQSIAIDHSIRKFAYPKSFYEQSDSEDLVRGPSYFTRYLERFTEKFVKVSKLDCFDFDGLGELMSELVENTSQHAMQDYRSGRSLKSTRGLIVDYKLIQRREDVSRFSGDDTPMATYLSNFKNNDEPLHLLEFSIFDSGCGISKSFPLPENVDEMSFEIEKDLLLKSFLDGVSSKPTSFGFGRGLNKARHILNRRNAFMSIRTGRISMYRDFQELALEVDDQGSSKDVRFYDETTRSITNYTELPRVEGVSYSIVVPVK